MDNAVHFWEEVDKCIWSKRITLSPIDLTEKATVLVSGETWMYNGASKPHFQSPGRSMSSACLIRSSRGTGHGDEALQKLKGSGEGLPDAGYLDASCYGSFAHRGAW